MYRLTSVTSAFFAAYRLGDYVLSARATDAGGNVSAPVTAAFTLR